MSMSLVLQQIAIIFGYVAVGLAAGKLGIINPEQRTFMTHLCSDLILPFTILSAASMEIGVEEFRSLGIALFVMFTVIGGTMLVSILVNRALHTEKKLSAGFTGLLAFPNLTFLGLPLCLALFGQIAVLLNCAGLIVFNVLFFAIQLPLFTGEKISVKAIFTVPTISILALLVMLVLGIHWPAPVQTVISSIGSMITPMSLIIIGVMLSENDLMAIFREKAVYLVTLFRNFLIPMICMLILAGMPLDTEEKLCVLVYLSCPCATLTTIYAIQTNAKPEMCARSVLFSTVAFAVSLPFVIAMGQFFFA